MTIPRLRLAAAVALAAVSGACSDAPAPADTIPAVGPARGWATPPAVLGVTADAGALTVHGQATAEARVRLRDLGGAAFGGTADREGRYAVQVPGAAPRLLAVSAEEGGRAVMADGLVFATPAAPGMAALLRPGDAALPLASGEGMAITAIDYDQSGGVAVSGRAPAGQSVQVLLDGVLAAQTIAQPDGRFAVRLAGQVEPGAHTVRVAVGDIRRDRSVTLIPPDPGQGFTATPEGGSWRVRWPLPGGGAQSTLLLGAGD
jgi:hypothetical protein